MKFLWMIILYEWLFSNFYLFNFKFTYFVFLIILDLILGYCKNPIIISKQSSPFIIIINEFDVWLFLKFILFNCSLSVQICSIYCPLCSFFIIIIWMLTIWLISKTECCIHAWFSFAAVSELFEVSLFIIFIKVIVKIVIY